MTCEIAIMNLHAIALAADSAMTVRMHFTETSIDELNYLTEDDLPSEIPGSDVALRKLEEFVQQHHQDSGPNSRSDDPSDSA